MFFFFFILPAVILIPVGIYYYIFFRRFFTLVHIKPGTWKSRILSFVLTLFVLWFAWPVFRFGAVVVLYFLSVCLIMEFLHFLLARWCLKKEHRLWEFLYKSGAVAVIFVAGFLFYGYLNIYHVVEKDYTISSDKALKDQPLRIAVITDLHLGTTMDAKGLKEYCDAIEKKQPDLLVLAGDIFDENTLRSEMQAGAKALGNVESVYGTFYVFGNHDANRIAAVPEYTKEELKETLTSGGIQVLEDTSVRLNDSCILIGRQDASIGDRKTTEELTEGIDPSVFTILLDHQPVALDENERAGIDLQISGHTHAGQIWPTGALMQLFRVSEWNYGYLKKGNLQLIVSSGIGGWGYPVRTGEHSEYVIIDIQR